MNILVFGAGAIGSVFGGLLHKSGNNVTLVTKDLAHANAITSNGLLIDGIWGEHRVTNIRCLTSLEGLNETFDIVLVAVKSYDTATAARAILPCMHANSFAVSVQNGLGNVEAIAHVAGEGRTAAARVIFGVAMNGPGHCTVTVITQPVLVGTPYTVMDSAPLLALAEKCSAAGIPCEYTEDIMPHIWGKALYNCALNPLGAILDTEYGALAENAGTKAIMDAIINEFFEVAQKKGVDLPWKTPGEYRELFYGKLVPDTFRHRSSMLQDMENGRPTEIDFMNGMVCAYADEIGVQVPANRFVTGLIHFAQTKGRSRHMFCISCGREILDPNAKFCQYCGKETGAHAPATPTPPPEPEPALCPWENMGNTGFFPALLDTIAQVLIKPSAFFRNLDPRKNVKSAVYFGVILGSFGYIFNIVWDLLSRRFDLFSSKFGQVNVVSDTTLVASLFFAPLVSLFMLYLGGLITHVFLTIVGGNRNGFSATLKTLCYCAAGYLFSAVPYAGKVIAGVWMLVISIIGISRMHGISIGRTIFALLLPVVLLLVLVFGLLLIFLLFVPSMFQLITKQVFSV